MGRSAPPSSGLFVLDVPSQETRRLRGDTPCVRWCLRQRRYSPSQVQGPHTEPNVLLPLPPLSRPRHALSSTTQEANVLVPNPLPDMITPPRTFLLFLFFLFPLIIIFLFIMLVDQSRQEGAFPQPYKKQKQTATTPRHLFMTMTTCRYPPCLRHKNGLMCIKRETYPTPNHVFFTPASFHSPSSLPHLHRSLFGPKSQTSPRSHRGGSPQN
ncbi:hypothetical protein VTH06DRAFT_3603 [Thermothelomyces fergusii]